MKRYLYRLLGRYVGYYIPPGARVVDLHPQNDLVRAELPIEARPFCEHATGERAISSWSELARFAPDRIILNGVLHYEPNIQDLLEQIRAATPRSCRLLITYYSSLWKPLFGIASAVGIKTKGPNENWIAPSDLRNLLRLSGFELVSNDQRVLLPVWIPLVSEFVNRWLAPLPVFRLFALLNVAVARPLPRAETSEPLSVSVIVAARNEAGNIEPLIQRLPAMGPRDELIFVEGGSSDDTWPVIQAMAQRYADRVTIRYAQQKGRGKGDAVRLGFSMAERDVLMILDADLTVPPEELPKFYRAITGGLAEFVNGSRLVYPMERGAMQFINMIGNKFFALAFSYVLGQPLKDTLCGTKVLRRDDYERLAASRRYFGDFDPFGDFDLLFGASKLALKIVEVPVRYRERTYGSTNIQRWTHGWLLLRMLAFASRRVRFI